MSEQKADGRAENKSSDPVPIIIMLKYMSSDCNFLLN